MTRSTLAFCLLAGSVGTWVIYRSWPSTQLITFHSVGFVSKSIAGYDGRDLRYVLYVPGEYNSTRPIPLIVFLHGEREAGFDGRQQLKRGLAPEVWLRHCTHQGFPYFVLFPQSVHAWGNAREDSDNVMRELTTTMREYTIDPDRVFLTGISKGGDALWDLAAAHSTVWAGLVPISCEIDRVQVSRVKSLNVRWYQNSSDDVQQRVRAKVAELMQAGCSVELIEFDDPGHDAWSAAYADCRLYYWLGRQVRDVKVRP